MKKTCFILLAFFSITLLIGCSRDSAEKIRYDMENLVYMAGKVAEKINIQPQLATAADSLALKNAYEGILAYFNEYRNHTLLADDEKVLEEMSKMAVAAQFQLARYYTAKRQADSVIAAYRRIGTEIPAGRGDVIGANLALAIMFRTLFVFDSTYAIYDRLLENYYPPVDSLNRVDKDIIAAPVDKIKIQKILDDEQKLNSLIQEALDYYQKLKDEFPDNEDLVRQATIHTSRVYTMTERWDEAIVELGEITDSTGQDDIAAMVLIANIYNGPKEDVNQAIETYRRILEREPDSNVIGSTLLQLGMALLSEGQHEEGRSILAELKKKFTPYPTLVSKAQYYYAQSFEVQGRWDRALSEYQWLMENHPYTEEAFWASRRVPEHFEKEGNQKLAETWYNRAADFYMRAASVKKGEPIEIAAYSYLAEIHRITQQWDKALEILNKIYSLAPESQLAAKSLYNAAAVAYKELGDTVLAQDYLNRLNREFGTTDSTQIYEEEKTDIKGIHIYPVGRPAHPGGKSRGSERPGGQNRYGNPGSGRTGGRKMDGIGPCLE
jgi:tetratricopeptide (TPR) repeat protein